MDISSATYIKQRNDDGTIDDSSDNIGILAVINGITSCVPLNSTNRHYKEIMAQVAAGDLTIAEAE